MIKFALQCDKSHGFESWFASGASYETQVRRGLVECPLCGSTRIEKQIMAPSVRLAKAAVPADAVVSETPVPARASDTNAVSLDLEPMQKLREMVRELHEKVQANTEDVGHNFAEEARKIHYGEAEERGIRGKATQDQAEALIEEGIGFLPLPVLPEERN
jgi:hypothetical protein